MLVLGRSLCNAVGVVCHACAPLSILKPYSSLFPFWNFFIISKFCYCFGSSLTMVTGYPTLGSPYLAKQNMVDLFSRLHCRLLLRSFLLSQSDFWEEMLKYFMVPDTNEMSWDFCWEENLKNSRRRQEKRSKSAAMTTTEEEPKYRKSCMDVTALLIGHRPSIWMCPHL